MKLRIKSASIRLRLTEPEVEALGMNGRVVCQTPFGPARSLIYSLEISSEVRTLTASFESNHITVCVPEDAARAWAESDQVSMSDEQRAGDHTLAILVEKDFQCLHKNDLARDPDAYPHPLADHPAATT